MLCVFNRESRTYTGLNNLGFLTAFSFFVWIVPLSLRIIFHDVIFPKLVLYSKALNFLLSSIISQLAVFSTLTLGIPNILVPLGTHVIIQLAVGFEQVCRVNSVHASSRCQTGVLHRMRAWTDTVSSRRRMLFSDGVRRRTRVFVLS